MKILVTGGSGLLGSAVAFHLKDYFDVTATYTNHKLSIAGCKTVFLDITDARGTKDLINGATPDLIVHTAALVGINICEKQPELAYKINVEGTNNLVNASKPTNSRVIYISTDYVFDGNKGMYKETDSASPINIYGKTKFEGELLINQDKDAIIRTSIYGWNVVKERNSFSNWIIEELSNNRKITVFSNLFSSMVCVNNFAEALREVIDREISGILNIASTEKISKYDFAVNLADIFGLDKSLISPAENSEMPGYEKRPLDTSLDVSKAKSILKTRLPSISQGIVKMKNMKENGYLTNFRVV